MQKQDLAQDRLAQDHLTQDFRSTADSPELKAEENHTESIGSVINLTEQVTIEEINAALAKRPYYPYRYLFSSPILKQRLIRYVLQRTNGVYLILRHPLSLERQQLLIGPQQTKIKEMVHQGIGEIALAHLEQKRYQLFHLRSMHNPIFNN